MYTINGMDYETYERLFEFFRPRTIVTSSLWLKERKYYQITISSKALLHIDDRYITIEKDNKSFMLKPSEYLSLEII